MDHTCSFWENTNLSRVDFLLIKSKRSIKKKKEKKSGRVATLSGGEWWLNGHPNYFNFFNIIS